MEISDNDVDGAGDVALDCEWCTDVVIARNVVRNGHNAGISLFLSCRDVLIAENTVGPPRSHPHSLTHTPPPPPRNSSTAAA